MIPIHILGGLKSIPHSSRTSVYTFIMEVTPPPPRVALGRYILRYLCDYKFAARLVGWLFLINVDLAIFQPYLDLEAGDNQSLKIQVARRGIEPRSSCSASQELNHSATAAPICCKKIKMVYTSE